MHSGAASAEVRRRRAGAIAAGIVAWPLIFAGTGVLAVVLALSAITFFISVVTGDPVAGFIGPLRSFAAAGAAAVGCIALGVAASAGLLRITGHVRCISFTALAALIGLVPTGVVAVIAFVVADVAVSAASRSGAAPDSMSLAIGCSAAAIPVICTVGAFSWLTVHRIRIRIRTRKLTTYPAIPAVAAAQRT